MSGALGSILSGGAGTGLAGGTALTLLTPLTGTGVNALSQVLPSSLVSLIRQPRALGSGFSAIIPDVTIEEHFVDRVTATQHPLATGTPVSDHVFRQPSEVTMRLGWTNAAPLVGAVQGAIQGAATGGIMGGLTGAGTGVLSTLTEQRAAQIYKQLLKLQYNQSATGTTGPVQPFNLTAGKRTYKNMIISELNCTNTAATEYALIIEVRMQELITVQLAVPTYSAQSLPQKTGSPVNTGTNTLSTPVQPQANTPLNNLMQSLGFGSSTPTPPALPPGDIPPPLRAASRARPRR
jgi:hypothetical protein